MRVNPRIMKETRLNLGIIQHAIFNCNDVSVADYMKYYAKLTQDCLMVVKQDNYLAWIG